MLQDLCNHTCSLISYQNYKEIPLLYTRLTRILSICESVLSKSPKFDKVSKTVLKKLNKSENYLQQKPLLLQTDQLCRTFVNVAQIVRVCSGGTSHALYVNLVYNVGSGEFCTCIACFSSGLKFC